jgi:release factor glutamine methyltransferase
MYSQEVAWLLEEKYRGQKSEAFLTDLAKLEAGVPLGYLIGHIPFLSNTIYLDSHPLIPRPETEFWVEQAIKEMSMCQSDTPLQVLDLCAGSGAIGVAVASSITNCLVDFIELDSHHLPTIAKNCVSNQIDKERVHIYAGDLFKTNSGTTLSKYHFILTNPPYIDKSLNRTEQSVIDNEPELALYGGIAGLEIIEKIILEAPHHLHQGGQLWIEHEPEQSERIKNLAKDNFLTTTHKDQYQVQRYSQLVLQ